MSHRVFISYKRTDKAVVDVICPALEAAGIPCWIDTRDVPYGTDYARVIAAAIAEADVLLLVLSGTSSKSKHVRKEVALGFDSECEILPVRTEEVRPQGMIRYYLAGTNWLDAFPPPFEDHVDRVVEAVKELFAPESSAVPEDAEESGGVAASDDGEAVPEESAEAGASAEGGEHPLAAGGPATDSAPKPGGPRFADEPVVVGSHGEPVTTCAFSSGGEAIISGSSDMTLRLWTASGGDRVALEGHAAWVTGCAFSPDGETVASCSADATIRTWSPYTGAVRLTLAGHEDRVTGCVFSPDGEILVSASWDKTLRIWGVHSGTKYHTLVGHPDQVIACAFSPDGETIVSASFDGTVRLWDAGDGRPRPDPLQLADQIGVCAVSPDGRTIASAASRATTVTLWDLSSSEGIVTLEGHTGWVAACAYAPDGRTIVTAGDDATLRIWETSSGAQLDTFEASGPVWCCAYSPLGDRVCCGGRGGDVLSLAIDPGA